MFKRRPKTAQQKAQRAQIRIFLRFAVCAYLVYYIIIPMLRDESQTEGMNPTFKLVVICLFIAVTAVIVVVSIFEIIANLRAGVYKPSAYTDDEDVIGISSENSDLSDNENETDDDSNESDDNPGDEDNEGDDSVDDEIDDIDDDIGVMDDIDDETDDEYNDNNENDGDNEEGIE